MKKFLVTICISNIVSAALLIGLVHRPICDEPLHIFDLHNYAARGASRAVLLAHRNAPGPTAYLWMAAGVHLLPGNELTDARIAVLASWMLLMAGIFVGARNGDLPEIWYGALLTALIFPHSLQTMATLLTEGPALLFAVLGVMTWVKFASPATGTVGPLTLGIVGGLSMGLAITSRQYYLALLLSAAAFAFYWSRRIGSGGRVQWSVKMFVSLLFTVLPVVPLLLVWKGFSSPGMAEGTSYSQWKATVGLDLFRPIVVAFYVAVYLVPLTFPAMFQLKFSRRRVTLLLIAFLGSLIITHFICLFLQPGPISGVVRVASRVAHGGTLAFALIAFVAIYNAAALCVLLWDHRQYYSASAPVVLSLLVIGFFIAEQVGVGGNLPFYDRYIFQISPFMGLIAFALLPRLTASRMVVLACLSVFSHFMAWRFAF